MAGRHSKRGARALISEQRGPRQAVTNDVRISGWSRWRRSSAAAVVQVQRLPGVELVDAVTRVAHRVSSDELLAVRQRGDYEAFCGTEVAPPLATSKARHCRLSAPIPTPRSWGAR
jgi:hypothetical protein